METDIWPFLRARWFTPVPKEYPRRVRVIVIHDMEAPEKTGTAMNVAKYFATTDTKASAHICVDNTAIIQCVHDRDVAWAAPGCNNDGIQIELAGYGSQARADWLDDYSRAVLQRGANAAAQYCCKYDIPPVHLTNDQLSAGQRGLVGHVQVSQVYKRSNHTDPGPNFLWTEFMNMVAAFAATRRLTHAG
jgi:N-acetyl-anhydromuramyl-L-alanine amidase AmpD